MPVLTEQQMKRVERNEGAFHGRGVSWKEARNAAEEFARASMCKGFAMDKVPDIVQEFSDTHPVRMFNVGPWKESVLMGTLGTYHMPACPDGKPYVEMTRFDSTKGKDIPAIGALVFEWLRGDGQMPVRQHEGIEVAQNVLGIAPFQNPVNARVKYGWFISECGPEENPSAQELAKANKALKDFLMSLVKDARKAEQDNKISDVVGSDHFMAARLLKLNPANEGWLKTQTIESNDVCPGCGTPYKKGIAVCKECKTILDEEKYKTLKRAS